MNGRSMNLYVKEIWRYPVKSLSGEQLEAASVGADGIEADRRVYVERNGRILTARTQPALLGLRGSLGPDGVPLVDGLPWTTSEAAARVADAVGGPVRLVAASEGAFDVLPLSIATDGAVSFLDIDRRRLRPNIVIGGADGLAERAWPGARITIGETIIRLIRLRPRCVMTTYDPDTQRQDHTVLRRIVDQLDGTASLDSAVEQPGRVAVGDPVSLAFD
jgi:uncharacterized protein YcbX